MQRSKRNNKTEQDLQAVFSGWRPAHKTLHNLCLLSDFKNRKRINLRIAIHTVSTSLLRRGRHAPLAIPVCPLHVMRRTRVNCSANRFSFFKRKKEKPFSTRGRPNTLSAREKHARPQEPRLFTAETQGTHHETIGNQHRNEVARIADSSVYTPQRKSVRLVSSSHDVRRKGSVVESIVFKQPSRTNDDKLACHSQASRTKVGERAW